MKKLFLSMLLIASTLFSFGATNVQVNAAPNVAYRAAQNYTVIEIDEAKETVGTNVDITIEAVITTSFVRGSQTELVAYGQNYACTDGIYIYTTSLYETELKRGNVVYITGIITQYQTNYQLSEIKDIEVIEQDVFLDPITTITDTASLYNSQALLVQFTGTLTWVQGLKYQLDVSPTFTIIIYIGGWADVGHIEADNLYIQYYSMRNQDVTITANVKHYWQETQVFVSNTTQTTLAV